LKRQAAPPTRIGTIETPADASMFRRAGLQSHHCLQSHRLRRIMTPIMKITHHFLARVGQVNKATLAT
jgi:hypothetical protein